MKNSYLTDCHSSKHIGVTSWANEHRQRMNIDLLAGGQTYAISTPPSWTANKSGQAKTSEQNHTNKSHVAFSNTVESTDYKCHQEK